MLIKDWDILLRFQHFWKKHCDYTWNIWDKVRDKLGIQSGLSKFCGRQPLKNLKGYSLLFKGCLPQNLFSSLFNTLSHILIY